MKAYVFPGQGAQFIGMGKDLYEKSPKAKDMFEEANSILGFRITDTMFSARMKILNRQRLLNLPYFCILQFWLLCLDSSFRPDMVAGHSLGEFSALVANKTL